MWAGRFKWGTWISSCRATSIATSRIDASCTQVWYSPLIMTASSLFDRTPLLALMVIFASGEQLAAGPIHDAAKAGDVAELTALADSGIDIDEDSPI